jgi:hypothetical protein
MVKKVFVVTLTVKARILPNIVDAMRARFKREAQTVDDRLVSVEPGSRVEIERQINAVRFQFETRDRCDILD